MNIIRSMAVIFFIIVQQNLHSMNFLKKIYRACEKTGVIFTSNVETAVFMNDIKRIEVEPHHLQKSITTRGLTGCFAVILYAGDVLGRQHVSMTHYSQAEMSLHFEVFKSELHLLSKKINQQQSQSIKVVVVMPRPSPFWEIEMEKDYASIYEKFKKIAYDELGEAVTTRQVSYAIPPLGKAAAQVHVRVSQDGPPECFVKSWGDDTNFYLDE